MEIETSSAIKLFFPSPSLNLIYFEAIANSLDANATEIHIKIEIASYDKPDTLSVSVIDNGTGFTDESFERFKTLLKPKDQFHKGIGRLVFLNYFNQVEITSVWGGMNKRTFVFKDKFDGVAPIQALEKAEDNHTEVKFVRFAKKRLKSYDDIKPGTLKNRIIEHFLPTLHKLKREEKELSIFIELKTTDKNPQKEFFSDSIELTLNDLPELELVTIRDDTIDLNESINIHYSIRDSIGKDESLIAFNIDGRTIPIQLIKKTAIPDGYSVVFLFESELFNASTDSSRQKLILPDGIQESYLYKILRKEIGKILAKRIPSIVAKNKEVKRGFEKQFPHFLGYFEDVPVGLIDRDEALDIAQCKFFQEQKRILQCETLSDENYKKSLELSSRALTEYVLYRSKIINKMKEMTEDDSEAAIHNLIVPRYNEFNQEGMTSELYQNNAWLLDDKFMVFQTILSEPAMGRVIEAIQVDGDSFEENGRPDITMIFSADPEHEEAVDVVVVEVKKKTNSEKDNQYAINQLLSRARLLAEHCENIQRMWYYAIIQVDDNLARSLRQQKWSPLFSKGQVFYQEFPTEKSNGEVVPTPMFIVSFDALVDDAEARNNTFLEILREGMRRYIESE